MEDLDDDDHHHGRKVDSAEVGQELADRAVERRGDPVDRADEGVDPGRAGVEDVEHDQPAEHELDDDDPGADAQQIVGDREKRVQHDCRLAARLAPSNQGAKRSGSATARISAKSSFSSVHSACGVQPPASNRTRPPRASYLWLFSVWIDEPAAKAKGWPEIVNSTSRVATRCISTRDKMSFQRASWRKASSGMSPSSSRLIRLRRLQLNSAVTP